jgi:hypothetical protein
MLEDAATGMDKLELHDLKPENIIDPTSMSFETTVGGFLGRVNREIADRVRTDPNDRDAFCTGPLTRSIGGLCIAACPFSKTAQKLEKLGVLKLKAE